MITRARLFEILQENFSNEYTISVQLFLNSLIERSPTSDPTLRYRITNILTGNEITSFTELTSAITAPNLFIANDLNASFSQATNTTPIVIVPTNIKVTLTERSEFDAILASKFGYGEKYLSFKLNYLNDNDTTLPLKITSTSLRSTIS